MIECPILLHLTLIKFPCHNDAFFWRRQRQKVCRAMYIYTPNRSLRYRTWYPFNITRAKFKPILSLKQQVMGSLLTFLKLFTSLFHAHHAVKPYRVT